MAKNSLGLGLLNFHDFGVGKLHRDIRRMLESTTGIRAAATPFTEMNKAVEVLRPQKVLGVTADLAKASELAAGKNLRVVQDIHKGIADIAKPTKLLVGPPLPSPPILVSEGVKVLSDTGWRRSITVDPLAGNEIVRAARALQETVLGKPFLFLRSCQALEEASEAARRLRAQQLCEEVLNANDMAKMKAFTREHVGLSEDFWPEVAGVLYESNWRDASQPFRFIRYVAWKYRRQRWHEENQPLIRTAAKDDAAASKELALRLHSHPGDRHRLFELLYDSPFVGDELTLLHARRIVNVPRCAIPDFLGDGWDARRVERTRKRMERKLKDFHKEQGIEQ